MYRLVCSEFIRVVFVDLLYGGRIRYSCRGLCGYPCDGVARHEAGQEEVKYYGKDQCDQEPQDLLAEIFAVAFQFYTSTLSQKDSLIYEKTAMF
jgi:hypothetical protein